MGSIKMIKREENILNNSIAYNVFNDNLVAKNYLALAYCVVGIEFNKKRYYPKVRKRVGKSLGKCKANRRIIA